MHKWLPDLRAETGPKYLAIANAIEQAVHLGSLRPGDRLPAQRDLAQLLKVDLTTVTRAYGIARDAGLIEGAGRLGSYVRNAAAVAAPSAGEAVDSGMNMPPQPGFALLADAIRRGTETLLRSGGSSPLLQYQPGGGSVHDRQAAANAFTARGLASGEDDIAITAGGQNALHAILGTIMGSGDRFCAGGHIYPGVLALAARFGLNIVPLASDEWGIEPRSFAAAAQGGCRTLYVVPTIDNPTCATMSIERRREIVEVARRYGVTIIEDDAYGQLPSTPPPSLASLAPELCWHISSIAKVISPAMRVAHVRAPSSTHAWRLAADIHETAVMAPPLNAALVSLWLRDGSFAALRDAVRAEAIARQRIALRHMADMDYATHPEGYHIWLRLTGGITAAELASNLRPAGLSIVPAEAFAVNKEQAGAAVRISIGGAIDHDRLRRAFERLEALLRRDSARAHPIV